MKCPACEFVCSDLRDLCPRCLIDLRPHKKSVGLAITNAQLSYEELLAKTAPKKAVSEGAAGAESSIGSMLRSIFGAPRVESAAAPAAPTTSPIQDRDALLLIDAADKAQPVPEPTAHSHADNTAPQSNDISELFNQAWHGLQAAQDRSGYEMRMEQFVTLHGREDVSLYFDLAHEALVDPSAEQKYTQQIMRSETVQIKSEELAAELKALEAQFSSPLFTLKGIKQRRSGRRASDAVAAQREPLLKLHAAPLKHRALAFAVDCALILFFAVILGGFLSIVMHNYPPAQLLTPAVEPYQLIPVVASILISAVALLLLYPLLMYSALGTTFGLDMFRIRLFNQDGKRLSQANIVVRSLLLPASLLFFGYAPLLFGKPALHDRLSRTGLLQFPQAAPSGPA